MTKIIDSLPNEYPKRILCSYKNATSVIQIARITNIPQWHLERIVFPGQHLLFEALPEAQLEIHTPKTASAILSDTIPCENLQVKASDETS